VVVAVAITVIALPSLWLMSRSGDSGAPNVATAGVDLGPDDADRAGTTRAAQASPPAAPAPAPPTTEFDPMGSAAAAYLHPPVSTPAPGPIAVAVPNAGDVTGTVADATYRSSIGDAGACMVRDAPFGATVTVTNRNNDRSITCRATVSPVGEVDDVVLATPAFAAIADLTDAPVPVDVDW
jgi:hypothetical protein